MGFKRNDFEMFVNSITFAEGIENNTISDRQTACISEI